MVNRFSFSLNTLLPVLIFACLMVVPFWGYLTDSSFYVVFFARIMIYAIAAVALNLALGYGGLLSLGHALFMGLGAYSVAIPSLYGIDNALVHLLICISSCAVVGFITGAISLRTTGIGFIMITLAFAQMGYFLFVSLKGYGGDDGTSIINTSQLLGLNLSDVYTVYVLAFFILLFSMLWTARVRVSPFGMVIRGARQNARRVNAIGFASRRYLIAAYVLSAVLCGIAGFLLANLNSYASPSVMSWIISGDLVVMVVLGGLGTVLGPLYGALAFLGLEEILKMVTTHWLALFGLAIVFIGLVGKKGVVGCLDSLNNRLRPGSKTAAGAKGDSP